MIDTTGMNVHAHRKRINFNKKSHFVQFTRTVPIQFENGVKEITKNQTGLYTSSVPAFI
jgi:hypothetical protein